MLRLSGFFSILISVFCGVLLFWTSQSVQQAEKELRQTQSQLDYETESLRVLTTEWDYLNRPERLQKLIVGNLDIDANKTVDQSRFEKVDELPSYVAPIMPKRKPDDLFHYISSKAKTEKNDTSSNVINKVDKNDFSRLLDSVMKEEEHESISE